MAYQTPRYTRQLSTRSLCHAPSPITNTLIELSSFASWSQSLHTYLLLAEALPTTSLAIDQTSGNHSVPSKHSSYFVSSLSRLHLRLEIFNLIDQFMHSSVHCRPMHSFNLTNAKCCGISKNWINHCTSTNHTESFDNWLLSPNKIQPRNSKCTKKCRLNIWLQILFHNLTININLL